MEACFNAGMTKDEAIHLLGGSHKAAAEAVGITVQAVSQWPDELSKRVADRIAAALWRKSQGVTAQPRKKPELAQ